MGNRLGRGKAGTARHRKLDPDTGRGGADDDDLVGVLGCRNLAIEHVIERVDRKGGTTVACLVELRQHQSAFVGLDAQFADLHRFAGIDLDVLRPEIEAPGGSQQSHGRYSVAIIINQQRLPAHGAIDVLDLVQVGDTGRDHPDLLDRLLPADGRYAESLERPDGACRGIAHHRLVRIALGFAELEHRRHQHIARALDAGGQHGVGIEHALGLGDDLGQGSRVTAGR